MAKRVTCIEKRGSHLDPHKRISGIGGTNSDGSRWFMKEDDAILAIENRRESFYVSVNRINVDVIVDTREGRKYLKTTSDGYIPNNLLSLDDCP